MNNLSLHCVDLTDECCSHYLFSQIPKESRVKFCSPQNRILLNLSRLGHFKTQKNNWEKTQKMAPCSKPGILQVSISTDIQKTSFTPFISHFMVCFFGCFYVSHPQLLQLFRRMLHFTRKLQECFVAYKTLPDFPSVCLIVGWTYPLTLSFNLASSRTNHSGGYPERLCAKTHLEKFSHHEVSL